MGRTFLCDFFPRLVDGALEDKANGSKKSTGYDLVAIFWENQHPSFGNLSLKYFPHVVGIDGGAFVIAPGCKEEIVVYSLIGCQVVKCEIGSMGEIVGNFRPEGMATQEGAEH